MFLFRGNPNIGAVVITPDIFNLGFLINKLITNKPPIACPYINNGKSLDAYLMRTSTSIYS